MAVEYFVRKLYAGEIKQRDHIEKQILNTSTREEVKAWIFDNSFEELSHYDYKEFNRLFYLEGKEEYSKYNLAEINQRCPRRYFMNENILGWNMFEEAEKAISGSNPLSFNEYCQYLKNNIPFEKVLRVVMDMAFRLVSQAELEDIIHSTSLKEWIEKISKFYARSFIYLPWYGKEKERIVQEFAMPAIKNYKNLVIKKASVEKDMKYHIDFMLLVSGKELAGISVKGTTYAKAKKSGKSNYLNGGETFENRGHTLLKKDYGVAAHVVISDLDDASKLNIFYQIQALLKEYAEDGKIEEVLKSE